MSRSQETACSGNPVIFVEGRNYYMVLLGCVAYFSRVYVYVCVCGRLCISVRLCKLCMCACACGDHVGTIGVCDCGCETCV